MEWSLGGTKRGSWLNFAWVKPQPQSKSYWARTALHRKLSTNDSPDVSRAIVSADWGGQGDGGRGGGPHPGHGPPQRRQRVRPGGGRVGGGRGYGHGVPGGGRPLHRPCVSFHPPTQPSLHDADQCMILLHMELCMQCRERVNSFRQSNFEHPHLPPRSPFIILHARLQTYSYLLTILHYRVL